MAAIDTTYARATWQHWLRSGEIKVNGTIVKPRHGVRGKEVITVEAELPVHLQTARAESTPLDAVFEDDHVLVLNKAAGMAMHPGAGIYKGTVLNALLGRGEPFSSLPRAGIVHRLDQDTSGLVAIAKSLKSFKRSRFLK